MERKLVTEKSRVRKSSRQLPPDLPARNRRRQSRKKTRQQMLKARRRNLVRNRIVKKSLDSQALGVIDLELHS